MILPTAVGSGMLICFPSLLIEGLFDLQVVLLIIHLTSVMTFSLIALSTTMNDNFLSHKKAVTFVFNNKIHI